MKFSGMCTAAFVLLVSGAACKGELNLAADSPPPNTVVDPNNTQIDPFPELPCQGAACETPVPAATPMASRLTHTQWERATKDLLQLEFTSGLSDAFIKDTRGTGSFDRMVDELSVEPVLWDNYRAAAEQLAEQVVNDPAALARIMPSNLPDDLNERSRAFVEDFGLKAWRRPLSTAEVDLMVALMDTAVESSDNATWEDRVELALRGFLQSPHFVYRIEGSGGAGITNLNGYERATRLAFALWNTTPDQALLDAAEAGALDSAEGVRTQVDRMLDDPRALDVVLDFHAQLFDFAHFSEMEKEASLFPNFSETTPQVLRTEMELFLTHTIGSDGTYRDLMLSRTVFADDEVAGIYGINAPSEPFGQASLNESQRAGILTRAGFLAMNATQYDPNPIHRGVFVNKKVLCNVIPLPPDNFSIPDGVQGNTNRERIENATGECGGACHTPMINPAGYAFENYDALGQWRTQEGEYPVDASGTLPFDQELNSFEGPLDFIEQVAESPQAHECYAEHWFEYLHGRLPLAGDKPLIARVAQASHASNLAIKELIAGLVVNDVFLKRDGGQQ